MVINGGSEGEVKRATLKLAKEAKLSAQETTALQRVIQRRVKEALEQKALRDLDSQTQMFTQVETSSKPGSDKHHQSREDLRGRRDKATQDLIFKRLWYDATEGKRKRQEDYEKVFKMFHPFQPDIGYNTKLRRPGGPNVTFDRLAYSDLRSSKRSNHDSCTALNRDKNRSTSRGSWRSLGKTKEELDQHVQKRTFKLVDELIEKVAKSTPKKPIQTKTVRIVLDNINNDDNIDRQPRSKRSSIHKSDLDRSLTPERMRGSNKHIGGLNNSHSKSKIGESLNSSKIFAGQAAQYMPSRYKKLLGIN